MCVCACLCRFQATAKFTNLGSIGCAQWEGPLLCHVIKKALPKTDWTKDTHVHLIGADGYSMSVLAGEALDEDGFGGMLAFKMNGELLTGDHGAPVRAIMPGMIGARSVKWLRSIILSSVPDDSPWQAHFYTRGGDPLRYWPVQCLILSHEKGDVVEEGGLLVRGAAYCGECWRCRCSFPMQMKGLMCDDVLCLLVRAHP